MRSARALVLCLCALVLLFLAGCAQIEQSAAERAVRNELPRIVGPAESYTVDIQGVRGTTYVRRVTASGKRVQPQASPVLDAVDVELADVTYDPDRKVVEKIGSATATIRVLPKDVADYLNARRSVQNASVTFRAPDRLLVQAQPKIPRMQLPSSVVVEATGNLIGEDSHVNYDITGVSVGGVGLSADAVDALSEAINPIVDLSAMPIALRVTGVHVERDTAVISVAGAVPPPQTEQPPATVAP